ncbi:YidC/Oxa1 family membrane protein insertase [Sneathia vaginalis]|jgi:inner membrane protein oxaA|uniref:YidC/Oxa1 family membrane protein insertase n=1 Tax=Sneathia vaginalis TaxID=187101 RepID=UPI00259B9146|nr:YidC/Oxa1 family membrane protein insertase [uncultured Sneathia sp.]
MKGIIALALFRVKFLETIAVEILKFFNSLVGNYGVAIILTTLLIKIILFPLSLKQEKSMQKMKELQPEIEAIQKKYKDDKTKLNEETAKLYKEKNVNPFSGCLPLIIQLPIFVALYYAFMSNEIPQTATFLWFNLKRPDAIYTIGKFSLNILPIISALLMIIQQKLMTPQSGEGENSVMQSTMLLMPVMMLFIFYKFPSGLNLYYVVNTAISILIQIYVVKKARK